MIYVVRVDIYECKTFPVVRHEFRGFSIEEARRYYLAHMKTDEFMRECILVGFYGNITCNTQVTEYVEE